MPKFLRKRSRRYRKLRGRRFKRRVTRRFVYRAINKNLEKKFRDFQYEANIAWTGNAWGGLVDIPSGTTDTARIGDKVRLKGLRLRYQWDLSDTVNKCRVIVFQWCQSTNYTVPAVTDILQNTGTSTSGVFSPYNHDAGPNYRILYDRLHSLDADNPSPFVNTNISLRRCKYRKISFVGGSTDAIGKIFVLTITDSAATPHPAFKAYARLTFTDA